ncbi:hypothetical protein CP968_00710 [Streptomyces subrutilus]|uniref:Uncharacterized protein n=1 Tax=Streptomyces subrutilus TaxID=36818 RepID=A0A5P2UGZ6_9ACTN|nr:hypothetical protein CP968_00710 [Streptomyces subrutilus]
MSAGVCRFCGRAFTCAPPGIPLLTRIRPRTAVAVWGPARYEPHRTAPRPHPGPRPEPGPGPRVVLDPGGPGPGRGWGP